MENKKKHIVGAASISYSLLKEHAKQMRKNPTTAEMAMWEMIRGKNLGVKFRHQHIIGDYIVDFVSIKSNLIIEIDGEYHNSPEQQEWDKNRTNFLNQQGFEVMRFTNDEVLFNTNNVLKTIKNKLEPCV